MMHFSTYFSCIITGAFFWCKNPIDIAFSQGGATLLLLMEDITFCV